MTSAQTRAIPCSRCGGSGMLRLGDQSFRTCLDCLGQGSLPIVESAPINSAVWSPVVSRPLKDAAASSAR